MIKARNALYKRGNMPGWKTIECQIEMIESMYANSDVLQNQLSPERLRRYLIVAAVLIGCMVSYKADASRTMRGKEYGDISFKRLVSVYRDAYRKAGFDVTTLVKKGNNPRVTLRMRFLPPDSSKKQKASMVLVIDSLGTHSHTCTPCSVMLETTQADSDDLDDQMQQADGKASDQIDKELSAYIWYDPTDWDSQFLTLYYDIDVAKVISSYKQAYAALGFELENEDRKLDNREIHLSFKLTNPGQPGFFGYSKVELMFSKSEGCQPCAVLRDTTINPLLEVYPTVDSDAGNLFMNELKEKDRLARNQAEMNLAGYLRQVKRRDITKLRQR